MPSLSSLVTCIAVVFTSLCISVSHCADTFTKVEKTYNETSIAPGYLDTQPVRLILDSHEYNIYVRCSVFERRDCETTKASDIPGSEQAVIRRQSAYAVTFVTKRYASVTIGGYAFKDLDVRIVYDGLAYLPPECDGILGMNYVLQGWQKRNVAFGLSLFGREFSVNEPLATFATRVPATIAINGYAASRNGLTWRSTVPCVRPTVVSSSSAAVEPCLPVSADDLEAANTEYDLDPAYRGIVLPKESLKAFAATYLTACTAQMNGIHTEGYLCSDEVAKSLPALGFEIDGWSVLVSRYKILADEGMFIALSDFEPRLPGPKLGAPFFNTVQVYVNTTADTLSIFCTDSSCVKAQANATSILDSLRNSDYDNNKGSGSSSKSSNSKGSGVDSATTPPPTTGAASSPLSATVLTTLVVIGSIVSML